MGNQPTNQTVFPRITSDDITKDFFQIQRYSDQSILLWIDSYGYIHPARPALLTNSILNNEQYVLNLKHGSGITLAADEVGGVTITATGGGGGTPAGPLYAVQINDPIGTFYGDTNFVYDPVDHNILAGESNSFTGSFITSIQLGVENSLTASATYASGQSNFIAGFSNEATSTASLQNTYIIGLENEVNSTGLSFTSFMFGRGNFASNAGGTAIGFENEFTGNTPSGGNSFYAFGEYNEITSANDEQYVIGELNVIETDIGDNLAIGFTNLINPSGDTGAGAFAVGTFNTLSHEDTYAFGYGLTSTIAHSMYVGFSGVNDPLPSYVLNLGVSIASKPEIVITPGLITLGGSLVAPLTTPASSSAAGVQGQIEWDANYVYVCIATNSWRRIPNQTF